MFARAAIVRLLCLGRPSAVVRLVVPIIIDTVDSESWRALAHIRQKVGKGRPAVAYRDAPAAVVRVSMVSGIKTALAHARPYLITTSAFTNASHAMNELVARVIDQRVTMMPPTRVMHHAPAATVGQPGAIRNQAQLLGSRDQQERASVGPSFVMHATQAACVNKLAAILDGANGSLGSHLRLILSGVTGADVRASRSPYFISSEEFAVHKSQTLRKAK